MQKLQAKKPAHPQTSPDCPVLALQHLDKTPALQSWTLVGTLSREALGLLPPPCSSKRTYSKSVSFLSSVTGLKATTFFRRPMTQAESGALANTRPIETNMW